MPLVCRNFSELVHNPSLLSDMDLDATQRKDGDSCVRGFCAYLSRRAAGHVQRVRLEFSQRPSGDRGRPRGVLRRRRPERAGD